MAFYFLPLGVRGATYAQITDGYLNHKMFRTDFFANTAESPFPSSSLGHLAGGLVSHYARFGVSGPAGAARITLISSSPTTAAQKR